MSLPKVFLVGNHEMGSSDLSLNSTNALSQVGEIVTEVSSDGGFGYRLVYLPYVLEQDRKSLDEYFKDLYEGMWETCEVKKTIILSHNDIKGIRYGQFESKTGFDIADIQNHCAVHQKLTHQSCFKKEATLNKIKCYWP